MEPIFFCVTCGPNEKIRRAKLDGRVVNRMKKILR